MLPKHTYVRNRDPAINHDPITIEYRRKIVEKELENNIAQCRDLKENVNEVRTDILQYCTNNQQLSNKWLTIESQLNDLLDTFNHTTKVNTIKRLNRLYMGQIFLKNDVNSFINLSNYELSNDEIEFLNLGLNFHIQPKYSKLHKQSECEILFQSLLNLQDRHLIEIDQRLSDQLRAESNKHRNPYHQSIITPKLRQAAKSLKNNDNIIIRKADKSSLYIILNKAEYLDKISAILQDHTKFKPINKDPTQDIKKKANKIIDAINAVSDGPKLSKIIGDYSPGYIYGNVKTHKPNNPIRPIISQVTTPTYQLSKTINKLITPYIPSRYSLTSTDDFIDLLHSSATDGHIASLDVESLFTNVPVEATIDIICKYCYDHPTLPKLKIPVQLLRQLLSICTRESAFRSPNGKLFQQIDGIAMGSALGPTFANFYMAHLEELLVPTMNPQPTIYCRYVDDIFIQVSDTQHLERIKTDFENNSVLKFTIENNTNRRLPFLDVCVDASGTAFDLSVYRKETNVGTCLNARSECPDKYKASVITSYLNRAYKISSSWENMIQEIDKIKQLLINNDFNNSAVDYHIKKFLDKKINPSNNNHDSQNKSNIDIFYQAQTHSNYKLDERVLKDIVYRNTQVVDPNKKLNLIIYYKNIKTHNLVMKNNLSPPPTVLQQSNVIYQFECPLSHGNVIPRYVGFTQNKLSRRLTMHLQQGSIRNHFMDHHNSILTRETIVNNTTIIEKAQDRYHLAIKEALLIMNSNPIINKQYDNFSNILRLNTHRINASNCSTTTSNLTPTVITSPTYEPQPANIPANFNLHNSRNPNINVNNNTISPNIQRRIENLLQFSQNSTHQDEDRRTPSPRRLRPRRQI